MSTSTFSVLALLVSAVLAVPDTRSFSLVPNTFPDFSACLSQPSVYSCENTTQIANTCCSPTPGGLVLQTQFWSFEQYCDLSRQYDPAPSPGVPPYTGPGVDTFILEFGRLDLLDYMEKYWISQGSPNKNFWAHEFSKHATCTSTFDVACYGPKYKKNQDVINFFDAVIRAFHQPPLTVPSRAGITPSNKTTYTLSQIQNALQSQTAALPYLGCTNGTILSEVWYFSHVYGTEQFGRYKTLDTTTPSTCSSTAPIWYYERASASEHEVRLLP
ncbi:ribonuclease T2-like protein [Mycena leptocephala]|nr:ribonuclease T2-like protein [Mycena leptocephala]